MAGATEEATTSTLTAGATEEATTTTLKTTRGGESREFEVETRLVMEECCALRDKIQYPNIHVEVDLDNDILEMVVSFLNLRKMVRDQFPSHYTGSKKNKFKPKAIKDMEHNWVETTFDGKFTVPLANLMLASSEYLKFESLTEALSEWIVGNMVDKYPEEINAFFGIECNHSEEFLRKTREEYAWAWENVEHEKRMKRERREMGNDANNNVAQEAEITMRLEKL